MAKVHPFNFVCFPKQNTQNQQKSIEILPKSEQNHGYLSYFLYMIGHQILPILHLEPQATIYKWMFQLDDSKSLYRKWLFHQTSIY